MSGWMWYGLRRGILTTPYPSGADPMPENYRGAVIARDAEQDEQRRGAEVCPADAITLGDTRARIDRGRCIQCGRCAQIAPSAFAMDNAFELATYAEAPEPASVRERLLGVSKTLGRSIHLRHVDAGSDGSEEQELQAIFNPFYDANRLGIFLTATPRHADILVVSGAGTQRMLQPLRRAYEAMPEPRIVIALGSTACSGAIFAKNNPSLGGVSDAVPVDVFVPGSPPSPLTILHGLLLALGKVAPRAEVAL